MASGFLVQQVESKSLRVAVQIRVSQKQTRQTERMYRHKKGVKERSPVQFVLPVNDHIQHKILSGIFVEGLPTFVVFTPTAAALYLPSNPL